MGNTWIDSQEAVYYNRVVQVSDPVYLDYTSGGTSVAAATRHFICRLPAKSIVIACLTRIITGFNAAGNDYLTVGSYADDDLFVNDLDISTAATPLLTLTQSTTLPCYTASDIAVYATYVYSSTAPSAGALETAIMWVPWTLRDKVTVVG